MDSVVPVGTSSFSRCRPSTRVLGYFQPVPAGLRGTPFHPHGWVEDPCLILWIKPEEMIHRPASLPHRIGQTQSAGDICLGMRQRVNGRVAVDQIAEQSAGKSTTGSMGGVGGDVLPRKPDLVSGSTQQKIIRPVEMAT